MQKTQLAALLATALLAMNAHAADLLQAYRDAQSYDSQFASARATREAGVEKSVQGRAGLLPSVALTGAYNKNTSTYIDFPISGVPTTFDKNYSSKSYQVQLTQPLYRPANMNVYEQGKLQAELAEIQFAQAQSDLVLRVAQAYFDVLAVQDSILFIQAQKAATVEQLESAKRNFEIGTATITDTHEAQARFDLILAQEIAADNDLAVKRNALAQVTGKLPEQLASLKTGVTLSPPEPASVAPWVASAETSNFGVAGQTFNVELAKLDISRSRAGHLPTLDFVALRSRIEGLTSSPDATIENTQVGLQFTLPLFSGLATNSKIREAVSLKEKARADLETAKRNAAQSARMAFLGVQSGLSQVRALQAAEISSTSALESNRLGYEVGVRINIDVLNAQQQLFSTRRDLAKARYDTLVNGLRLKAAAGSLAEADLAQLNALLAPL
jgi:outer membrane protein